MFPVDDVTKDEKKIDTDDERKAFDSVDDEADDKDKNKDEVDADPDEDDEVDTEDKDEDGEKSEDNKEDDDEDEDDDKDEEINNDTVYQTLKKEGMFKKIPELRSILFREQEFSSVYPSVEAAKEAAETAEVFKSFQEDIVDGNSENLLESLKKVGDKNLENFLANFTGTVEKISNDLYLKMLYPEFKKLLRAASKSNNETLEVSAKNLHWFIFGDTNLDSEVGLKPTKKDENEDRLSKREREFEARIQTEFTNDVGSVAEKRLKRIISVPLKDSDISPLLQAKLVDEIFQRVNKAIAADRRHMGNINHLWEQAKRAGFTSEWKDRIITAFLSRAKVLTPKVRREVLIESKASTKTSNGEEKKAKRIPSSGAITSKPGAKIDPKQVDWDKANERDMLDGKIPLKGK